MGLDNLLWPIRLFQVSLLSRITIQLVRYFSIRRACDTLDTFCFGRTLFNASCSSADLKTHHIGPGHAYEYMLAAEGRRVAQESSLLVLHSAGGFFSAVKRTLALLSKAPDIFFVYDLRLRPGKMGYGKHDTRCLLGQGCTVTPMTPARI